MLHSIPTETLEPELGVWSDEMARAVGACVHCGFCLPTCPTYLELGEEMDSPRGRIVLMKGALEGELTAEQVAPHVDACLGCVACVTACPSGVRYGELVTPFRRWLETRRRRPLHRRLWRWVLSRTLAHPRRFRLLVAAGAPLRPLRRLLPAGMRAALDLLPSRRRAAQPPPDATKPSEAGETRGTVALLRGCVQSVLAPELETTTVAVLRAFGYAVEVPAGQGCCGGLALHAGDLDQARSLARRNVAAFDREVTAVVTNAAGCGSTLREAPLLFAGEPEQEAARRLAARSRDVSSLLAESLGEAFPRGLPPLTRPLRAVYHDACHLLHAQGERDAPRELLRAIPGLELLEPRESEICCGSAGTYNLEQPALAERLGERKARRLIETGAEVVIAGNLGCALQIERSAERVGRPLRVLHTVEAVALALFGESLFEELELGEPPSVAEGPAEPSRPSTG